MAIETKIETVDVAGIPTEVTKSVIAPESEAQADDLIKAHRALPGLPKGVVGASISQWYEGETIRTEIKYDYAKDAVPSEAVTELLAEAKIALVDVAPGGIVDAGVVAEEIIP